METIQALGNGFGVALQPVNILYCLFGVILGTIVGVLPGIGPSGAIALLLPSTYHINPVSAMIMFAGICYGAMYGGSTTAILLNIPGEPSSAVTALDGYQMARQGRAGTALGVSAIGSFVAGTFSVIGLVILAPILAKLALSFGPPEYFSLMLMSLTMVTYLARISMIKALMMALLGLILGTVGMDPISGVPRFTFGIRSIFDGFGIPAVLMGLFGVSEVLENIVIRMKPEIYSGKIGRLLGTFEDWKRVTPSIFRGTILGFILGIFPGVGSIVPTFLSYILEKRLSAHPEKFGTGEIKGVGAAEACNNAAVGATFIPLLSLGVPSGGMTALLLAALMIFGLHPGPLLIKENPNLFWGVVSSMYIGNVMLLVLNLPLIPLWVMMLRIPYSYLSCLILLFCLIGAYSLNNNPVDIMITIFFGVLGYFLREFKYELAPLILAYVIGPLIETALRRSLIMSDGSLAIFISRPGSAFFVLITFILLIISLLKRRRFGKGLETDE